MLLLQSTARVFVYGFVIVALGLTFVSRVGVADDAESEKINKSLAGADKTGLSVWKSLRYEKAVSVTAEQAIPVIKEQLRAFYEKNTPPGKNKPKEEKLEQMAVLVANNEIGNVELEIAEGQWSPPKIEGIKPIRVVGVLDLSEKDMIEPFADLVDYFEKVHREDIRDVRLLFVENQPFTNGSKYMNRKLPKNTKIHTFVVEKPGAKKEYIFLAAPFTVMGYQTYQDLMHDKVYDKKDVILVDVDLFNLAPELTVSTIAREARFMLDQKNNADAFNNSIDEIKALTLSLANENKGEAKKYLDQLTAKDEFSSYVKAMESYLKTHPPEGVKPEEVPQGEKLKAEITSPSVAAFYDMYPSFESSAFLRAHRDQARFALGAFKNWDERRFLKAVLYDIFTVKIPEELQKEKIVKVDGKTVSLITPLINPYFEAYFKKILIVRKKPLPEDRH